MKIEFLEYLGERPHGDRATKMTPCSKFSVVLVNDNGATVVLSEFNQFDSFSIGVLPREPILQNALGYARKVAATLGCEIVERQFRAKVETKTTWVEV